MRKRLMGWLDRQYRKQIYKRTTAHLAIIGCEEKAERGESVGDVYRIALEVHSVAHVKASFFLWLINILETWLPGRKLLSEGE